MSQRYLTMLLIWSFALPLFSETVEYELLEVVIPDRTEIYGKDMNELGQVVGYARGGAYVFTGFLWTDGQIAEMDPLARDYCYAELINDSGQVAGSTHTTSDMHAFIFNGIYMQDLGNPGGGLSRPNGMNNAGQIVGWGSDASDNIVPIKKDPGGAWEILAGGDRARSISDSGDIVGRVYSEDPILWKADGTTVRLPRLRTDLDSTPFKIEHAGLILGANRDAIVWEDLVPRKLDGLGGAGAAYDANANGDIVGTSSYSRGYGRAALWRNGSEFVNLSTITNDTSITLTEALAINERGQILCNSYDKRCFILNPVSFSLPPNNQPQSPAVSMSVPENGGPLSIDLPVSDADGDSLQVIILAQPENGSVVGSGSSISYTPDLNFNGTDTFDYIAFDGREASVPGPVTVNVGAVNNQPVAYDTGVIALPGTTSELNLRGEDADGDALSYRIVQQPAYGQVQLNPDTGSYEYVADSVYVGSTSAQFVVNDGTLDSEAAEIQLTVSQGYRAVYLGTLDDDCRAYGLNEHNQVVGSSTSARSSFTPFIWENGVMRDIGYLTNSTEAGIAYDINDNGVIVGESGNDAFIWNGVMDSLPGLGMGTEAHAIDNNGVIYGLAQVNNLDWNAVRWTNAVIEDQAFEASGKFAVSNSGLAAGSRYLGSVAREAVFNDGSGWIGLGHMGYGDRTQPAAINNDGRMVGTEQGSSAQAFQWTAIEGFQQLLDFGVRSYAYGINNNHAIVGSMYDPVSENDHACMWIGSALGDLNDLLVDAPTDLRELTRAYDVNDNGAIVANGYKIGEGTRAYLLLPVDQNLVPVADAGLDQTVDDSDGDGFVSVLLDGSASLDSDGSLVSYEWSLGGSVLANGQMPTVSNLSVGSHAIMLTVTDDRGASNSDNVTITVNAYNPPPSADAGYDQQISDRDVNGTESITLDASGSHDSDGIVSYVWTESGVEVATGIRPTLAVTAGTHVYTLTVTDSLGVSASDDVTVIVSTLPSIVLNVVDDGASINQGDVVDGQITFEVQVINGQGQHLQAYANMAFLDHAMIDSNDWRQSYTVNSNRFFDGENLLSVHVHPHEVSGQQPSPELTYGTFLIISTNGNPAPQGDTQLPQIGASNIMLDIDEYTGDCRLNCTIDWHDDKGTGATGHVLPHLGSAVLGRDHYRASGGIGVGAAAYKIDTCSMVPYQLPGANTVRVVLFATDHVGRANYHSFLVDLPGRSPLAEDLTGRSPQAQLPLHPNGSDVIVDGDFNVPVDVNALDGLRVPDGEQVSLRLWAGNTVISLQGFEDELAAMRTAGDSTLSFSMPVRDNDIRNMEYLRIGKDASAHALWVDILIGGSTSSSRKTIPVSGHSHLNKLRTRTPNVYAGADSEYLLGQAIVLNGIVDVLGNINPASATYEWVLVSSNNSEATITINGPDSHASMVTIDAPGVYEFELTAHNGFENDNDTVVITVADHSPPIVNAGADQQITIRENIALSGTATDDVTPAASLLPQWSLVSGPGEVHFTDANAFSTDATFTVPGDYVLRLSVSDGDLTGTDELAVTVDYSDHIAFRLFQNGEELNPDQDISGVVDVEMTFTGLQGQMAQFYVNFLPVRNVEEGAYHAMIGSDSWVRWLQLDTADLFDGENLINVHVHPHQMSGQPYLVDFEVGAVPIRTANAHTPPLGDRQLPKMTGIPAFAEIDLTNSGPRVEDINPLMEDDSFTGRISNDSNTDNPVQIIPHLGTSVLGRFRWASNTPPHGDGPMINRAYINAFQGDVDRTGRIILFCSDAAGRANYAFVPITIPAKYPVDAPSVDAHFLNLKQGDEIVVPRDGSTFLDVEVTGITEGQTALNLWVGNRSHVTAVFPDNISTATIKVPVVYEELRKMEEVRAAHRNASGFALWMDLPNRFPTSEHVHCSVRTEDMPWPHGDPDVRIFAPEDGAVITSDSVTIAYYHAGDPALIDHVEVRLDGVLLSDDDGDRRIAVSGLSTGTHTVTVAGVDPSGNALTGDGIQAISFQVEDPNLPPVVDAGMDQSILAHESISLSGTASDDGLPSGTLTYQWQVLSGPGTASFSDAQALATTASFSAAGAYILRLTASDGSLSTSDDLTVTVAAPSYLFTASLPAVGGSWQEISLPRAYASPVVIATPISDDGRLPVVTRVMEIDAQTIAVKIQQPGGHSAGTFPVQVIVLEAGVYTDAVHGFTAEASRVLSTLTDHDKSWQGESLTLQNSYTNPVVLGQVQSVNDSRWSQFWARGAGQKDPPAAGAVHVGKHVAEDPDTSRADELLGVLIIESGLHTIDGLQVLAGLGANSVQGMDDAPPYAYALSGLSTAASAVLSSAGMNGNNGGWPLLYGSDPIQHTALRLAIEEDQLNDSERVHIEEEVAYLVADQLVYEQLPPTADMTVNTIGGIAPLTVSFDASGSSDPNNDPLNYSWEFGDDQIGAGLSTNYIYTDPGTYTATLTVSDAYGGSDQASVEITVTEATGPSLTTGTLPALGSSWQQVVLPRAYNEAVILATAVTDTGRSPMVVRVDEIDAQTLAFSLQQPGGGDPGTATVHYLVMEAGVYTQAEHGVRMEALRVNSSITDHDQSWQASSLTPTNTYSAPVVLGQVQSVNDARWSQFWARGSGQKEAPGAANMYVGKHVAEDSDTQRNDELLGVLIIESGLYTIDGIEILAGLGADSVLGITDNPPYTYAISGLSSAAGAVLSSAGMDGGNGGWPLLYGAAAVETTQLSLAIEEDQIKDSERDHISEQAAYLVFSSAAANAPPAAMMTATPEAGQVPLDVSFDASESGDPDGDPLTYSWDFGDGQTGGGVAPAHTYNDPGMYTAQLTVSDDSGASATSEIVITVQSGAGPKIYTAVLTDIDSNWQTLVLPQAYTAPVLIATAQSDSGRVPVITRVRVDDAQTIAVRIQQPGSGTPAAATVQLFVAEAGVYTQAQHGIDMEAVLIEASNAARKGSWPVIDYSYQQSYTAPVVLGQVMGEADTAWSCFFAQGASRTEPPSASVLRVGHHVGEDPVITRAATMLGFVVIESGLYHVDGLDLLAGLSADNIKGHDNAPPFSIPISGLANVTGALLSPGGMDGGDGGWPVLYGSTPINTNALEVAFDEDQLGDSERAHTTEQLGFIAIDLTVGTNN